MKQNERVVVTGLGVITSIGVGKKSFWSNLIKGTSGISEVRAYDTKEYDNHFGGEVRNFNYKDYIGEIKNNKLGAAALMGIVSLKLAMDDANISADKLDPLKTGVIIGSTGGESSSIEASSTYLVKNHNFDGFGRHTLLQASPASMSASISSYFGFGGYTNTIATACAAGNYSIINAYNRLRHREEEVIFAGGIDVFSIFAFAGFNRLKSVAPERCQPFDKNRKGIIVSEGAGIIMLETLEHAQKRNAKIYAELAGYGLTCDAFHITGSDDEGLGASRCMKNCLAMSNVKPEEVDYISAHGTGTPRNDKIETIAVKKCFGDQAYNIPISSIKSMLGHTMGAASAIEAVATCLAIENSMIPPTINYETPDPECDLNYVPNSAIKKDIKIAISNSYAFGGNNATICLKKI